MGEQSIAGVINGGNGGSSNGNLPHSNNGGGGGGSTNSGTAAAAAMSGPNNTSNGQFGDTTYTKVFVGGLAWETQRDTMRRHFEQYGEILEAVVIMDKSTGRSKGYGFVTFRDAESAKKACMDATPVIDGRRTNCNLASLGANRSRSSTYPPHLHLLGNRMMGLAVSPFSPSSHHQGSSSSSSALGPTFLGSPVFPQHYGFPAPAYQIYGFPPYSPDHYGYQTWAAMQAGMYNPLYGSTSQYGGSGGHGHHQQVYAGGNPSVYPYNSSHQYNMQFSNLQPHLQYPGTAAVHNVSSSSNTSSTYTKMSQASSGAASSVAHHYQQQASNSSAGIAFYPAGHEGIGAASPGSSAQLMQLPPTNTPSHSSLHLHQQQQLGLVPLPTSVSSGGMQAIGISLNSDLQPSS